MKKILSIITAAVFAAFTFTSQAELNGTGYYRINNYKTGRYIYVIDNTGSLNVATTSADMGAIDLWLGQERTLYDPSTVLYLEHQSGIQYDIRSQGTGIHDMISMYVSLGTDPRYQGVYTAYGSAHGMVKYLFDGRSSTAVDQSYLSDQGNAECKYWYITPINSNTDNYFGVMPNVTAGSTSYASFFAEFPFTFASSGMNAYYISNIDTKLGYAVYKEITGTVPGKTPVIIKCNTANYTDNRLNIGGTAGAVSDNVATGVYFKSDKAGHVNRVAYDPATMRVLGTMADGSLALITSNIDFIPHNTFYVKVPTGCPAELQLVTEAEYAEILAHQPVDASGITLSSTELALTLGETAQLTATVAPENVTDNTVTYQSSNTAVATVDANGLVTSVGVGNAVITATTHNGISAQCSVTVNPVAVESVVLSQSTLSMFVGDKAQLTAAVLPDNATYKNVTWTSSNDVVATVDADGNISALGVGTATIAATATNGVKAECVVTVSPVVAESITFDHTTLELLVGDTAQLVVTFHPENTTFKTVEFTSSAPAIVSVDQNGALKAESVGEALIKATTPEGLEAVCEVVVSSVQAESITLDVTAITLEIGEIAQINATVLPENTTYPTIEWSTSDPEVAEVDHEGRITALKLGSAVITAKCGEASAACEVTVVKISQTIRWEQSFDEVTEGDVIVLTASATSGLDVAYAVSGVASAEGNVLTVLAPGEVKIVASQDGDDRHAAAQPVEVVFNALAGINDAFADGVTMTVKSGEIQINGKDANTMVYVYNMAGALVYAGTDSNIVVAPNSMYIVRIDSKALKTMTR